MSTYKLLKTILWDFERSRLVVPLKYSKKIKLINHYAFATSLIEWKTLISSSREKSFYTILTLYLCWPTNDYYSRLKFKKPLFFIRSWCCLNSNVRKFVIELWPISHLYLGSLEKTLELLYSIILQKNDIIMLCRWTKGFFHFFLQKQTKNIMMPNWL